jgi:hypothetical protein
MNSFSEPVRQLVEEPDRFLPDQAVPVRRVPGAGLRAHARADPVERLGDPNDGRRARRDDRASAPAGRGERPHAFDVDGRAILSADWARDEPPGARVRPCDASTRTLADGYGTVKPPPAPPDGVEAKLVTDFDEYVAAHRISLAGFAVSDDVAAQQLAALPDMWKRYDGVNRFAHLVFVDGRPIGSSFTSPARSASCSTAVPSCPRLAAAAPTGRSSPRAGPGPWNSRNLRSSFRRAPCRAPILERCGFQPICVLDLLDDSAVAPAAAA